MVDEQDQMDFFDSPLQGKSKGEKSIMDYPFFALDRRGHRKRPLRYDDGGVHVEIKANSIGIATVYDKDLILYVAGLMREQMNRNEEPSRTFTFAAHDFMRATGRPTNDDSYRRLQRMLERLQGTQIKTNIEHGGQGVDGWFSWLDSAFASYGAENDGRTPRFVRVTICEWLYRAICQGNVLTYDPRYFNLRPLSRRLYDIGRSHCGRQRYWAIKLPKLKAKVGYEGELRRFRWELEQILKSEDEFPEYHISMVNNRDDRNARYLEERGFRLRPSGKASNQDIVVLYSFKGKPANTVKEFKQMMAD